MELLLAATYTAFFIFLIGKMDFYNAGTLRKPYWMFFFLIKVAAGVAIYVVYTFYYTDRLTADTFKYFDDSAVIFDLLSKDRDLFWDFMLGTRNPSAEYMRHSNIMNTWWNQYAIYNDARTMIRLNVIFRFFTFGYYHVHSVIFAFISFTGLMAMGKVLAGNLKNFKNEFLTLLFMFPSIAFWSAGVMKDGLIFFTLGFCMYYLDRILSEEAHRNRRITMLLVMLALLFYTKLHIFFLFITCGLGWIWAFRAPRLKWAWFLSSLVLCLAISIFALHATRDINLWSFAAQKQHENIRSAETMQAGSYIPIGRLDGSFGSWIRQSPMGFLNALFRPHPLDRQSPVILISTIENMVLLLLILFALISFSRPRSARPTQFYFALCFVVMLFTIVGIMTPVMGALVRYKIQGLPFLFFVLLSLADRETAEKRLPFLRFLIR